MITASDLLAEARDQARALRANEARRRSIVSRAFYAAFHHIDVIAHRGGYRFSPQGRTTGLQQLIRFVTREPIDPNLCTAGCILEDFKSLRRKADYGLDGEVSAAEAHEAIAMAEYLMTELLRKK